jgi:hypothetical protein
VVRLGSGNGCGVSAQDQRYGAADKDYEQSDVKHLLKVRRWSTYAEMIDWLRRDGDADSKLTPSEVGHLVDDLSRLKRRRTEFITEPTQLYNELKRVTANR